MGASAALAAAAVAASALLAARLRATRLLTRHASHELRGPLTAAGLALDSLVASGELPSDRAEVLAAQLRRARLALDDLIAAPLGERAPDSPEPLRVADLVGQLARGWAPVAAASGVELRVSGAAGGTLLADRTRLLQAAGNLLANALEHGRGTVELRVRQTGERVRLEVRDGGGGLPAPVAALARRRPRGARGHGLAIAAGIAERHGGRLVAAPSARGAALALELPLAGAPRDGALRRPASEAAR